jgi:glyoxylase I family protein
MNAEIDHLVLWVRDRDRALAFYEDVMGFPCCNDYRERGGLFPSVRVNERTVLDLFPRAASLLARIVAREWPLSGAGRAINHLCFSLSRAELDALSQRLDRAGVKRTPATHAQVGARGTAVSSCYLQDPDANVLQLICYEP